MTTLSVRLAIVGIALAGAVIQACTNSSPPVAPEREDPLSLSGGPVGPMVLPEDYDLDGDGLNDTSEETLVRRYLPYWDFDGQENIRPLSIEDWASVGYYITNSDGSGQSNYIDIPTLNNAVNQFPSGVMHTNTAHVYGYPFCNVGNQIQPNCNNHQVFVDAQEMPTNFCLYDAFDQLKCNLVWLHYYIFFSGDYKVAWWPLSIDHKGDWEHVCVMAEKAAVTNSSLRPVQMHWHHHGGADVSKTAWAYHSDSWGNYHPRAFVEQMAHGIYRQPESSWSDGGGSADNPLNNPIIFMTPHWMNRNSLVDEIVRNFSGRWGQSVGELPGTTSPKGPLHFNGRCDHDYKPNPVSSDWAQSC